ncbi:DEAD/DEAH box helicase family protein [Candidatus Thiothrix sp. Deng01]|uniref:DEAD/DEAH box helicase family protein n=1 Tax=Candidatus Thiothrix phosphatis TaxID=3112415 RepID=A0ABU6D2F1_9GAMM|nr:DEAD/DEAH box helicase family protein [Candidatus Thiothrix sp. Deng01]MEB4593235.1 DEAD/DEAH box helicase family protein [Candidatus Thiothrix sp. Deng01]
MTRSQTLHDIKTSLSLRPPQAESLQKLATALETAPAMRQSGERDLSGILDSLKTQFPTLEDFEREFPSLCFALATGVGKTRLMGAFITYLHQAYGINNFFVLAPNLTIYNKLIADFTPNTPKYVFKGIHHFVFQPPEIITGDNYEYRAAQVQGSLLSPVTINIFNIAKINSEVRGGKEPRIKRMKEVLGDSYFNYLANLPDLVMLMDESHRYRASAGVRSINELKPLFGLELTATPFVETSRGPVAFKNVVMDYPLARAMADGFVKEPAVVTQRGFTAAAHTPDEIERIKLEDGIRLHEITKVELITHARENSVPIVKPFMLVIARDTTHAAQLLDKVQTLFEGRYQGKAIQVDSSKSGAEEEEMITRLLAVESVNEPTEIVIHVNMLKEGWDVTNLYTIVPLRAANARTLIEQSIGRGLRLPYGKRTGNPAVDRLNIVAHDRFQEIIDEANQGDSPIRLQRVILDAPTPDDKKVSIEIRPNYETMLGQEGRREETPSNSPLSGGGRDVPSSGSSPDKGRLGGVSTPIFKTETERETARVVAEVAASYAAKRDLVPTSQALLAPEIQQAIAIEVSERLTPQQGTLFTAENTPDLATIVAKTTEVMVQQTIDIPRILVNPTGEVETGFHPFKLDVSGLHLQPGERELVGQMLRTNEQFHLKADAGKQEQRLEDYVVFALIDYDDIDYFSQKEILYDLAGQMVAHLRSYLSEDEAHNVLNKDRRLIAREIHAQMLKHFWERASGYEVQVSRGFTPLKTCNFTANANQPPSSYRETVLETSKIKQMLFAGFEKCLYPLQKFDSDTERRFAVILERDAQKWFKPVKGQFQIYYKLGTEQPEYVPDFVAETDTAILVVETKAKTDMDSQEVQAKANAARRWCQHASTYAQEQGTKPWHYLLVPHDEVREDYKLMDFLRFQ